MEGEVRRENLAEREKNGEGEWKKVEDEKKEDE